MSRKRPARLTFADIVAEARSTSHRAPVPHVRAATASPLRSGHLMFAGTSWQKRGPALTHATAIRLAATEAAFVLIADGGGSRIRPVDNRVDAVALLKTRYAGPGGRIMGPPWPQEPVYTAYRFDSDDGNTLLYIDTDC
ncbi:hypothetical protein GCM10029964_058460 [Kibdelosporangium lantanae]